MDAILDANLLACLLFLNTAHLSSSPASVGFLFTQASKLCKGHPSLLLDTKLQYKSLIHVIGYAVMCCSHF